MRRTIRGMSEPAATDETLTLTISGERAKRLSTNISTWLTDKADPTKDWEATVRLIYAINDDLLAILDENGLR